MNRKIRKYEANKSLFTHIMQFNPFQTNVLFLCPLKMSKYLWFSDYFREYSTETMHLNELIEVYLGQSIQEWTK